METCRYSSFNNTSISKTQSKISSRSCCYIATACLVVVLLIITFLSIFGVIPTINETTPDCDNWIRPETTTSQGTLRGINMVTNRNRRFSAFLGVPFAEPPVGDLRFEQAVPAGPWNGTLDADHMPNACIQNEYQLMGDEDCLYLNVYTPQLPNSESATLLPVMIYIYGGEFRYGTSGPDRWSPEFLLDKDVVLVVPNYRFGILGWLSTGDEVSPGNNLIKDIVEALRWIQQNIKYFGGDPNQVTIFGGSSGAASIRILSVSPLTEGLFHQYMTQGTPRPTPAVPEPYSVAAQRATQLGEYLGCATNTSTALVDCLRTFNGSYLYETAGTLNEINTTWSSDWFPVVEPDVEGALITDTPDSIIANGQKHDLPWVALLAKEEGVGPMLDFYNKPDAFQQFLDNVDSELVSLLRYDLWSTDVDAQTAALKSRYLNNLTADSELLIHNLTEMVTDYTYTYPTYKEVKECANNSAYKSPVYICAFHYRGTFSHTYKMLEGDIVDWGAVHGDELLYLFPGPNLLFGVLGSEYTETDMEVADAMVELWTSFAINGLPTTAALNENAIWEPFSSDEKYIQIGNEHDPGIEVKSGFHEERMQFWGNFCADRNEN